MRFRATKMMAERDMTVNAQMESTLPPSGIKLSSSVLAAALMPMRIPRPKNSPGEGATVTGGASATDIGSGKAIPAGSDPATPAVAIT